MKSESVRGDDSDSVGRARACSLVCLYKLTAAAATTGQSAVGGRFMQSDAYDSNKAREPGGGADPPGTYPLMKAGEL